MSAPIPSYVMPDASEPDYEAILEQLCQYHSSHVGSSYYYIRKVKDDFELCRIMYGSKKIFFHEIIDHDKHGISNYDIEHAVRLDTGKMELPDHYLISPHIETKLRTLYEH
jgi:hypothetical protein